MRISLEVPAEHENNVENRSKGGESANLVLQGRFCPYVVPYCQENWMSDLMKGDTEESQK
jgi:hypothetical protein